MRIPRSLVAAASFLVLASPLRAETPKLTLKMGDSITAQRQHTNSINAADAELGTTCASVARHFEIEKTSM